VDKPMVFTAAIYDIRTKRDGGGRLQIDFGADALHVIQELQKIASVSDTNFTFAVLREDSLKITSGQPDHEESF
jgi:hypothetical protein